MAKLFIQLMFGIYSIYGGRQFAAELLCCLCTLTFVLVLLILDGIIFLFNILSNVLTVIFLPSPHSGSVKQIWTTHTDSAALR